MAIMVLSTLLILSSFSSILILGLADADEFEPKYIHLSWARNDVYHTITIVWWTKYWTWSKVYYDTVPHEDIKDYAHVAIGTHYRICAYQKCFEGWYHEVTLRNLKPGTTYYFRVRGVFGTYSDEYKFRTIAIGQKVKFVVSGDDRRPWGGGYEIKVSPTAISNWPWARDWVTVTAASESPDFVIFTGDMVNEGNNQELWNDWLEMMQEKLVTDCEKIDDREVCRLIPIVAVIGNHEMGAYPNVESTYAWFRGIFANPENGPKGYEELAYSLDFPNLHLTVLATTGGCVATWWDPMEKEVLGQLEWLKEDLASSDAEWKIVAFHVPYYSCYVTGTGYPSELILKYWAPIIEDPSYGVDLVINGHVHNYMRSWPVKTIRVEEVAVDKPWTKYGYKAVYDLVGDSSKAVTYIIAGTWGAPTDPYEKGAACDIRDYMASAYARPGYLLINVTKGSLTGAFKDTLETVLDEFTLPYTAATFPTPEYNSRV